MYVLTAIVCATAAANLAAAAVAPSVSRRDQGVNCEGKWPLCRIAKFPVIGDFIELTRGIHDTDIYAPNKPILCTSTGQICAMYKPGSKPKGAAKNSTQGMNMIQATDGYGHNGSTLEGITGKQVKAMLGYLDSHGCGQCGTQPIDYAGNNPDTYGVLTVNNEQADGCIYICPRLYNYNDPNNPLYSPQLNNLE